MQEIPQPTQSTHCTRRHFAIVGLARNIALGGKQFAGIAIGDGQHGAELRGTGEFRECAATRADGEMRRAQGLSCAQGPPIATRLGSQVSVKRGRAVGWGRRSRAETQITGSHQRFGRVDSLCGYRRGIVMRISGPFLRDDPRHAAQQRVRSRSGERWYHSAPGESWYHGAPQRCRMTHTHTHLLDGVSPVLSTPHGCKL